MEVLGVWLGHKFSIKDLIVLNSLRLQGERDVGVGQRRYHVSSDVEWSTVGHRGVEVREEVLGGGGLEGNRRRKSRVRQTACLNSVFIPLMLRARLHPSLLTGLC